MTLSLLGLRSVVYGVSDLDAAKAWWAGLTGVEPYFDQAFYVGFSFGGYELGLMPMPEGAPDGALAYWGVDDVNTAVATAIDAGASEHIPAADVGEGIITATVRTPDGGVVGFIQNPFFKLTGSDKGKCPIPGVDMLSGLLGMAKGMIPR